MVHIVYTHADLGLKLLLNRQLSSLLRWLMVLGSAVGEFNGCLPLPKGVDSGECGLAGGECKCVPWGGSDCWAAQAPNKAAGLCGKRVLANVLMGSWAMNEAA